jgi:hypothetical protein
MKRDALKPRNVRILNTCWIRMFNSEASDEDEELVAYVELLLSHIDALTKRRSVKRGKKQ